MRRIPRPIAAVTPVLELRLQRREQEVEDPREPRQEDDREDPRELLAAGRSVGAKDDEDRQEPDDEKRERQNDRKERADRRREQRQPDHDQEQYRKHGKDLHDGSAVVEIANLRSEIANTVPKQFLSASQKVILKAPEATP